MGFALLTPAYVGVRAAAFPGARSGLRSVLRLGRCRLHDREDYAEGTAHALFALDFDPAVVLGHDAVGDRQAQAGAAADGLAGVERGEDARPRVGRDAAAAVGDADPGLAVLCAGGDDDCAAVLDRLAGVDQPVHQHPG